MDRRELVKASALALAGTGLSTLPGRLLAGRGGRVVREGGQGPPGESDEGGGVGNERFNVAFVISPGANVIDLAGAWEVFQDVMIGEAGNHGSHHMPYRLYTVSDRRETIEATGGLQIVPDYTLGDAPSPDVVSVGAQRGSAEIHEWLREQVERVEVLMSVCTGAFQLGRAGLLDGRRATTHHDYWDAFEEQFPDVELVRGRRFVEDGDIVTAGGLTSGIDAALHVVARMLGEEAAERTAAYMEYESDGWRRGLRTSAAAAAAPSA